MNKAIALVGSALLLVAVLLALTPIHAPGVSCGAAYADHTAIDLRNSLSSLDNPGGVSPAVCDEARSNRQMLVWVAGLPGLLLLGAGSLMLYNEWATTPVKPRVSAD